MTALSFTKLISEAGLEPKDVVLIRHQKKVTGRPTSYGLWAHNKPKFELFQSTQSPKNRKLFSRPFWASFVVPPDGSTLFVGIYAATLKGSVGVDVIDPITGLKPGADKQDPTASVVYDLYETNLTDTLSEYRARLKIDWGKGYISWKQGLDSSDKKIVALAEREIEDEFPGFLRMVMPLSDLANVPYSWKAALASVGGIYLLTCPRTKQQYIGQAWGAEGFWGRWESYITTGHGGNLGLKSADPSDYQVSILEVCGSATTRLEVDALESLWKRKLQSREMGLNKN